VADRYNGTELFNSSMTFVRQITIFQGHADVGRDIKVTRSS